MASSKLLCSSLDNLVVPVVAASSNGVLPMDAICEILLRLPAKELCRLRVICWQWQSLLSDPSCIAAHGARHTVPLIVAGYPHFTGTHVPGHPELLMDIARPNNGILCEIMDLSGQVVKRVRATWGEYESVVSTNLDLICTTKWNSVRLFDPSRSFRLINPASGTVHAFPEGPAEEHDVDIRDYKATIMFGQVVSSGEYKVLRILETSSFNQRQLCEVLTLDGSTHARWRGANASPGHLSMHGKVAVSGIVYFFLSDHDDTEEDVMQKHVASFDLGTEEWRAVLRGPMIRTVHDDDVAVLDNYAYFHQFTMADLNETLVVVHDSSSTIEPWSSVDLWFLIDSEQSLWVKQHSIRVRLSAVHKEYQVLPLLVLHDGRILTYIGIRGLLRIYNPTNSTYTDVSEIGHRVGIGLYTGNLLSLPNGIR